MMDAATKNLRKATAQSFQGILKWKELAPWQVTGEMIAAYGIWSTTMTRAEIQNTEWSTKESLDIGHIVRAVTGRVEEFHMQTAKLFAEIRVKLIS
jgi:hypothetical protein